MEHKWYKFYEQGVPKQIDFPKIKLNKFLDESAAKFPKRSACNFLGKNVTYKKLADYVSVFAGSLRSLGVKEGSKVSICLPNCPQFMISFYAILKLGAVVTQTNPLSAEMEIEYLLNDSDTEIIITLDLLYPKISKIKEKTKLKTIIVTSIKDFLPFPLSALYPIKAKPPKVEYSDTVLKFPELLKSGEPVTESVGNSDSIALLQYTGGTTGISKGVILTHFNLVANTMQTASWLTDAEPGGEIILTAIPFFHVYGMTTALNMGMYLGATLLLIPKFEVKRILKTIQKYKPTIFPGVPLMYMKLNDYPKVNKYNLKSIKACISGAAPLPVQVKKKFEALTHSNLVEGYGLSEASPVTHANPLKGTNKPGSIGIPVPETEVRIADLKRKKKDVPLGDLGELVIKGPQVMQGYWNRKEETENVIKDGWLYTGDIVTMDEDGYFYIVDRKKEMILTASGQNIYPREVEEVLYTHPKIAEAAVIGIPSEKRGETVKAFIVVREEATENEIKEFCEEKLVKYKIPEYIEFRESLPKSLIGKVLKRVLLDEEMNDDTQYLK
jgi:long-chain acyl-CoA synthetase